MELKDFIKQSLLNVVQAVKEANETENRFKLFSSVHLNGTSGEFVEFDIGVVVQDSMDSKIGGKIGISVASIGSDLSSAEKTEKSQRLKFRIFVCEKIETNH